MPVPFRASTRADAGAIAALCQRVLAVPAGSPMFTAEQMEWKYWSDRPDWPGSRSYLLADGSQPVAHGAVLPLSFGRGGRPVTLLHLFDWAAESGSIGSGVSLLRRTAALADGLLILGGSRATQAMAGPLGFRQLPSITRYAVPAVVDDDQPLDPLDPGLALGQDLGLVDAFSPRAGATDDEILFQRSGRQVTDFLRCPAMEAAYFSLTRQGAPLGYFLLAFAAAQARIVEAWSPSPELADWVALLQLARRQACQRRGVEEVVCLAGVPLEQEALLQAGFSPCGTLPLFVLTSRDLVPDQARVRLRMMDGDIAFLHHGAPERWGAGAGS